MMKYLKKQGTTKRICLILCSSLTLSLTACSSESSFLNEYSELGLLENSDSSTMVDLSKAAVYAKNLAVISLLDNSSFVNNSGDITANSGLLVDQNTNEALYFSNIFEQIAPASLTKLMTALVVLKYGNLDDEVTITEDFSAAVPDAQVCGFQMGDKVTLRELFYCMMIYSGNDTAHAIALNISGSVSEFCELMNKGAGEIGATNTNFVNPHGLDENNHYTTAYDLYLIFNECIKYDTFIDAIGQDKYKMDYTNSSGEIVSKEFPSTNLYFLKQATAPSGGTVLGGKTGTTDKAGNCLILYFKNGDKYYISLLLGNADKTQLYSQMNKLLEKIQN